MTPLTKEKALAARMEKLKIVDEDLVEKFIIGSGRGGQKLQKTSSCVYLKHLPTGIEIKCQKARSRELNRYYARKLLCEALEELLFEEKSQRQVEIAKIRKQKIRRKKRTQEKVLKEKKERGSLKILRSSPLED